MSFQLAGYAYLLQNSLLTENLLTSPPKAGSYSSLDSVVRQSVTTSIPGELEDTADISPEAYKKTLLDGIQIPKSPTAAYNNNFSNMLVDYLNRDISYDFLNR